jgi:hypothetical protein
MLFTDPAQTIYGDACVGGNSNSSSDGDDGNESYVIGSSKPEKWKKCDDDYTEMVDNKVLAVEMEDNEERLTTTKKKTNKVLEDANDDDRDLMCYDHEYAKFDGSFDQGGQVDPATPPVEGVTLPQLLHLKRRERKPQPQLRYSNYPPPLMQLSLVTSIDISIDAVLLVK